MVEKYIMLDMNDSRYDALAQVLGNKTAKKIVNVLAEKDFSEADLARELKLPINTIEYNLKKLVNVGLVESTSNFFWSVKGKKIKTYKLSNKKIIISTKSSVKNLVVASLGVGLVGFLIKILSNLYLNTGSSLELANSKASDLVSSAAPRVMDSQTWVQVSVFQNTLMWFILGCAIGLILYLVYKKLKGGSIK